ncbi:hypothetical protein I7I48_10679 [Histoplasma ohiense]|nr:hypothetical protein I7I48_10679 [Histoplasma ohiense (nom. inval.)]
MRQEVVSLSIILSLVMTDQLIIFYSNAESSSMAPSDLSTHHTRCGMCDGRRRCDGGNNVGCAATTLTTASTVLTPPSPRSPGLSLMVGD